MSAARPMPQGVHALALQYVTPYSAPPESVFAEADVHEGAAHSGFENFDFRLEGAEQLRECLACSFWKAMRVAGLELEAAKVVAMEQREVDLELLELEKEE